jgi:hypothetical protein
MQSTSTLDLQVAEAMELLDCGRQTALRAVTTFARMLDGGNPESARCTPRQLRWQINLGLDGPRRDVLCLAHLRTRQREKALLSLAAAMGCDLPLSTREWLANL